MTRTRKTHVVALIVGIASLSLAGAAGAAPTISLTFSATTGTGTPGGNTIFAVPGDVITMVVSITSDANGLSFTGVSLDWLGGALTAANAVECPSDLNGNLLPDGNCLKDGLPVAGTIWNNSLDPGVPIDNVAGGTGQFTAFALPGSSGVFTLFTGQIEFTLVGPAIYEISTFYQPGLDSVNDNLGNVFFPSASAWINIPEPGTASLLGLGLMALGAGARRGARRAG